MNNHMVLLNTDSTTNNVSRWEIEEGPEPSLLEVAIKAGYKSLKGGLELIDIYGQSIAMVGFSQEKLTGD